MSTAEVPEDGKRPAFVLRSLGTVADHDRYCEAVSSLYEAKTKCPSTLQQIEQSIWEQPSFQSHVNDWFRIDKDWPSFWSLRCAAAEEGRFLGGSPESCPECPVLPTNDINELSYLRKNSYD